MSPWLGCEPRDAPRVLISYAIVLAFIGSPWMGLSAGQEKTLELAVTIVLGYWLGSSRGSADKSRQMEEERRS